MSRHHLFRFGTTGRRGPTLRMGRIAPGEEELSWHTRGSKPRALLCSLSLRGMMCSGRAIMGWELALFFCCWSNEGNGGSITRAKKKRKKKRVEKKMMRKKRVWAYVRTLLGENRKYTALNKYRNTPTWASVRLLVLMRELAWLKACEENLTFLRYRADLSFVDF